ncbi:MAG: hypothetical protein VKK59_02295 [Vampirovibrionales bacterium]|nr:hypothetical protein [Vampirovibrionales bacterium]
MRQAEKNGEVPQLKFENNGRVMATYPDSFGGYRLKVIFPFLPTNGKISDDTVEVFGCFGDGSNVSYRPWAHLAHSGHKPSEENPLTENIELKPRKREPGALGVHKVITKLRVNAHLTRNEGGSRNQNPNSPLAKVTLGYKTRDLVANEMKIDPNSPFLVAILKGRCPELEPKLTDAIAKVLAAKSEDPPTNT